MWQLDSSKILLADADMYHHQNMLIRKGNLLCALSLFTQSLWLHFCLYVTTCHSMPVLKHRPLLPYFADCHFTWKIKLKTNNACHFYVMTNAFGLGLPDNLGQSILMSVVSLKWRGLLAESKISALLQGVIQHIAWYIYDFKKATKLVKVYFSWWRWCLIAVEYF